MVKLEASKKVTWKGDIVDINWQCDSMKESQKFMNNKNWENTKNFRKKNHTNSSQRNHRTCKTIFFLSCNLSKKITQPSSNSSKTNQATSQLKNQRTSQFFLKERKIIKPLHKEST